MTLRHYEIFSAVAGTGSFTKAARQLFITQSAVSHAIRELEENAQTPLFDRLSKSVVITRAGELLLEEIRPILTANAALESHIGRLEEKAPIHVVSTITIALTLLPGLQKQFQSRWPDIPVLVNVVPAAMAMDILQKGGADIALTEGTRPEGPYICKEFGLYQMKFVCAPDYRKNTDEITIEELCGENLLLREKGSAIRDTLDSALYLAGYKVHPGWCSVNSQTLIAAAQEGLGITLLPDALIEDALRSKALVPISVKGLNPENQMLAIWHKNKYMSEPLRSFISKLPHPAACS